MLLDEEASLFQFLDEPQYPVEGQASELPVVGEQHVPHRVLAVHEGE